MTDKRGKISVLVQRFAGRKWDAHYLAYFDCFNRQLFYEAHEVLEAIWLPRRAAADGDFYKGLIQLAGAFVHVQKARPGPARSLLRLAESNLRKYPEGYEGLSLGEVFDLIETWNRRLESGRFRMDGVTRTSWPELPFGGDL